MIYRFDKGDRFIDCDIEYEIVYIDYEDDEFPYECWPTDIVDRAKQIAEDGGFTDDDGEFWDYDDHYDVLCDNFIDDRLCCSNYDIKEYLHKQSQKEIKMLKTALKKLQGDK